MMYRVPEVITEHPFRAPHQAISHAGLLGGGHWPRLAEISLAYRSVLLLVELTESGQHGLEVLRQPLKQRTMINGRASASLTFPANFILIAAMDPCRCGSYGDPVLARE